MCARAGKSTTLSILSGLYPPSSGRALIAGHDVESELSAVYTVLGICPQADRVWDELTVQQTLTFYARLKGVDRVHENALVQRIAEMVSLDGDAFGKRASTLSGGTRRRLSIAISLIGNPAVWLLDEPSTGLSAEARREVWDIVSRQKAYGRCIIITTHSVSNQHSTTHPTMPFSPFQLAGGHSPGNGPHTAGAITSIAYRCSSSLPLPLSVSVSSMAVLDGGSRHAVQPHRHRVRRQAAGHRVTSPAEGAVRGWLQADAQHVQRG